MNIQEFRKKYFLIKDRGFIKITRKGDGKFGNTFEDLLGLVENNLKTPDIDGWELKVMKNNTSSLQTLFHKDAWVMRPSNFLKDYGIPHKTKEGELSCNTTVTRKVNNRGFYLDTDDNYLYVKHNETIIAQYDWETLTQCFMTKFPNAIKVYGDERKKIIKFIFIITKHTILQTQVNINLKN